MISGRSLFHVPCPANAVRSVVRSTAQAVFVLGAFVGLSGCGAGSAEVKAEALFERVRLKDCNAFRDLWSLAEDRTDAYAATFLGMALQEGAARHCLHIEELALRAYSPAIGKVRAADFNAALLHLKLGNAAAAETLLKRAAGEENDRGLSVAMVKLAQLYEAGAKGFARQPALAAQYYARASDAGDVEALAKLGEMTLAGEGVEVDRRRGLQMMSSAAQLGSLRARRVLHEIYARAPGDHGSQEQAAKWLGAAVLLDPSLKPQWKAYMATLPAEIQSSVTDELVTFEAHVKPRWTPINYDQPIKPE